MKDHISYPLLFSKLLSIIYVYVSLAFMSRFFLVKIDAVNPSRFIHAVFTTAAKTFVNYNMYVACFPFTTIMFDSFVLKL